MRHLISALLVVVGVIHLLPLSGVLGGPRLAALYGIAVDARHLSLIGDFMMAQGDYRPCSRAGMETSTSPLLKMSFETAAAFLVDATMRGQEDTLESPSARIVLGRTVDMGTGTFGLRYDMKRAAELREEMKKNVGVF